MTILQVYAALGGVPYYFSLLDSSKSAAENIDTLFFSTDAEFKDEFHRLYKSLYRNPEKYMDIIKVLAKSREGMTRKEIATALKMSSGEDPSQPSPTRLSVPWRGGRWNGEGHPCN
ncbi:MAG: hypothetical protein J6P73_05205 [Bacteroidales bacterium]|nr:hypothetical protein [Bacteroidales bacterium]